jgi:hypothetical protein
MLDAINSLSIPLFIVFVIAVLATVTQLALLVALATHVNHIKVTWGLIAAVAWTALFALTR